MGRRGENRPLNTPSGRDTTRIVYAFPKPLTVLKSPILLQKNTEKIKKIHKKYIYQELY
jgi:hypothetical protein